jgi:hypothetical protein
MLSVSIELFDDDQAVVVLDSTFEAKDGARTRGERRSSLLESSGAADWLAGQMSMIIDTLRHSV